MTKKISNFWEYGLAALLCVSLLTWTLKLWKADLSFLFNYSGDASFGAMMIKGMIENGWYLRNEFVGMPGGLDLYDYPNADNLHFLIMKFISLIFPDYAKTINLYYLLSFPLTAIIALYVLRQFRISYVSSLIMSLLFAFLPYHFMRNEGHLFLSCYYLIPLMVMLILWVWTEDSPLSKIQKPFSLKQIVGKQLRGPVIICLLFSSSGLYYSFFGCFFLTFAGIVSSFQQKKFRPFFVAVFLIGIIGVGFLINLTPNFIYQVKNGRNTEVTQRNYIAAEIAGLKIAQLLLPIQNHRLSSLARFREGYSKNAPLVNENDFSTLGFIGSLGFLFLLGGIFLNRGKGWGSELKCLSYLTLAGVLLSTIGGFSTLLAVFVPQIRAYNRISVYISFFSLFAVATLLDNVSKRLKKSQGYRIWAYAILPAVLGLGILDQTSPSFIHPYDGLKMIRTEQAVFIKKIEGSMPPEAMIFQLPYVPFPENPPIHKMIDYDHFSSGYLCSRQLRWSYGAIKGRKGDSWQKSVSSKPVEEFLEVIYLAGFQGLYIDRYGYEDQGIRLEKEIKGILGIAPLVSPDQRYAFYSLKEYGRGLKGRYSEQEWEKRREMATYPLSISWGGGFSGPEGTPENNWRWCSRQGVLYFHNPSLKPKKVELNVGLATGYDEYSEINISGDLLSAKLKMNSQGILVKRTIIIPPGRHEVKFKTDAKNLNAPGDLRTLVFRVNNFRFQEID